MNAYSSTSYDKVAEILETRAAQLGCLAFSLKDEPIPADIALDSAGPLTWALVIHAGAIAQLAGIARPTETNALPLIVTTNEEAPFGNETRVQAGRLPMSLTMNLLDSALEHAICTGMRQLGYKPSEWDALPDEIKVIPLEPYFVDLQQSWVTEALELGDTRDQVLNWPTLMDRETLETFGPDRAPEADQGVNRSRILKMSSLN